MYILLTYAIINIITVMIEFLNTYLTNVTMSASFSSLITTIKTD